MNVQLFYIRELSWFQWTLKIHLAVSRFTLTSYCLCLGINAGIKSVIDCILLGKPKVLQQASREHDTLCWMMSPLSYPFCVSLAVQMLMRWLEMQVTEMHSDHTCRNNKHIPWCVCQGAHSMAAEVKWIGKAPNQSAIRQRACSAARTQKNYQS